MNRQQAPQPVVRPLPILTTPSAVRDLTLAKPVNEDGMHEANFIIQNVLVEAGDENVVPLVTIDIRDNNIYWYLQVCDYDGNGHVVNATGVTTQVLCDDLPCAIGMSNINDATKLGNL